MDEAAIRAVVARLARPHPSGGTVIERAAIVAEGGGAAQVVDWIIARAGRGEAARSTGGGGLHGARSAEGTVGSDGPPLRYILPAGVLD
jgi:hypothetical protein